MKSKSKHRAMSLDQLYAWMDEHCYPGRIDFDDGTSLEIHVPEDAEQFPLRVQEAMSLYNLAMSDIL